MVRNVKAALVILVVIVGLARLAGTSENEVPIVDLKHDLLQVRCPSGTLHVSGAITTSANFVAPIEPVEKHRYIVVGLEVLKGDGAAILYCGEIRHELEPHVANPTDKEKP
jgi:hypothetical protein